ncbi:helix-turn-helix domain-containing protein [Streptomyces sp. NBC_01766]|uniref:helix-turn-helix domain-containing protein n=1 Tax=Streptomyces sp. NBC_01766 TaxID=2975936 RepID=UPI002DDA0421|nr:helix-turn-helix transcriptional regulator [Streptomyces sp. NBC_01766]WSC19760.1 helix-turn-helix transcriptional regulator [Streptomyces sp. NBC_01766]
MHQTPPFDAPAARRLREALGMAPGHVAHGLRAQYGLLVTPDVVAAWERGLQHPTSRELTALAGVLWCSVGDLLVSATTLREHRLARGTAAEDLSRLIGMDTSAYLKMEESGRWRGNERQTAALAETLALTPAAFLTATGRDEELAGLLRSAVTTRWQAYVRPTAKLVPLSRAQLEPVLEQLHSDYQAQMVRTLNWGAAGSGGDEGRDFLDSIVGRFWTLTPG